jgi:hypothetical protein
MVLLTKVFSGAMLNIPVALMKLASSIDSLVLVRIFAILGMLPWFQLSMGHCSFAYFGQYSMKCSTVSLG